MDLVSSNVADFVSRTGFFGLGVTSSMESSLGSGPFSGMYVYSTPLWAIIRFEIFGTLFAVVVTGVSTVIVISDFLLTITIGSFFLTTGFNFGFSCKGIAFSSFGVISTVIPSANIASLGSCCLDNNTFSKTSDSGLGSESG